MGIKEQVFEVLSILILSTIYIAAGFKLMERCEKFALEKING